MTSEKAVQISGFLGLCARAGQLIFGQEACVDAVRRHKAGIILLDKTSSANTRKRFLDTCATHETLLYGMEDGAIAKAVGKDVCRVVAVKPGGMTKKMIDLFQDEAVLTKEQIL